MYPINSVCLDYYLNQIRYVLMNEDRLFYKIHILKYLKNNIMIIFFD